MKVSIPHDNQKNDSPGSRDPRGNQVRAESYDEWDSRFMLRSDQDDFTDRYNEMWGQKGWFKPSCIPISIILVLIVLVVLLPLLDAADKHNKSTLNVGSGRECVHSCKMSLVETIPYGMIYKNGSTPHTSTFDLWMKMIANANLSIEVASFYWTLQGAGQKFPGVEKGEAILQSLIDAGSNRNLTLKVIQSEPNHEFPNSDTEVLAKQGNAEVRSLNMPHLVGAGILHTKLWLVDRQSVYVGSANTDWRSLSQVKEMGIFIEDCPCLVDDIAKIFDVYWMVSLPNARLPSFWPEQLSTLFNSNNPVEISINNTEAHAFVSSSPPELCTKGRTSDIDSILYTIRSAKKFVYIAVMDYIPMLIYGEHPKFWPVIDNALREVALDSKVEVRLLISWWNYSRFSEKRFLQSLVDITHSYKNVVLQVKLFIVPSDDEQKKIDHARVNHNKYMVTDNTAYIGTSNWAGDYFTVTGGVGVVVEGLSQVRQELEDVFMRDWTSEFAKPLWQHDN